MRRIEIIDGGSGWGIVVLGGFGLDESEYWELPPRVNALGASAPLRGVRPCKASGR
jgi:hypothetical protein